MARDSYCNGLGSSILCGAARWYKRFLGAIWGPVATGTVSQYCLRATRPTIPVEELTAVTVALMLLRQSAFEGEVFWGRDRLYSLGIMLLGQGAVAGIQLVKQARAESRAAKARWNLKRVSHTVTHWFPSR